jgi:hypothetical protein
MNGRREQPPQLARKVLRRHVPAGTHGSDRYDQSGMAMILSVEPSLGGRLWPPTHSHFGGTTKRTAAAALSVHSLCESMSLVSLIFHRVSFSFAGRAYRGGLVLLRVFSRGILAIHCRVFSIGCGLHGVRSRLGGLTNSIGLIFSRIFLLAVTRGKAKAHKRSANPERDLGPVHNVPLEIRPA